MSPYAIWAYSWIRPPSRSRRRTRISAFPAGGCASLRAVLLECPVRPVSAAVIDALAQDQPQVRLARDQHPVGAENLCHLGICPTERGRSRLSVRRRPGQSWSLWRWDDLRLVGLKLIFLVVSRAMSLIRLSHRESWWKDAEILMLRHQLADAQRQRPRVHARLTWPDRAWLALLAGTLRLRGRALRRPYDSSGTELGSDKEHVSETFLTPGQALTWTELAPQSTDGTENTGGDANVQEGALTCQLVAWYHP